MNRHLLNLALAASLVAVAVPAQAAGFGAIYFDAEGGAQPILGWSWRHTSSYATEQRAAWECARRAGRPCTHGSTYAGQRAAFVHGYASGAHRYNIFQSAFAGPAQAQGLAACQGMGYSQCRLVGTACAH